MDGLLDRHGGEEECGWTRRLLRLPLIGAVVAREADAMKDTSGHQLHKRVGTRRKGGRAFRPYRMPGPLLVHLRQKRRIARTPRTDSLEVVSPARLSAWWSVVRSRKGPKVVTLRSSCPLEQHLMHVVDTALSNHFDVLTTMPDASHGMVELYPPHFTYVLSAVQPAIARHLPLRIAFQRSNGILKVTMTDLIGQVEWPEAPRTRVLKALRWLDLAAARVIQSLANPG